MKRWLLVLWVMSCVVHADLSGVFVGIDPGHGGSDPGAIANGLQESTLNLQTALALKTFLEADGAKVVLSRSSDISLTDEGSGRTELVTRARFFNSQDVDYMFSVHHNAFPANPQANGVLAYVARGNCNAPSKSGPLAERTVAQVMKTTQLNAMQGANGSRCSGKNGVFEWGAVVVTETKMPAVLQEISFITNLAEAAKLSDPEYVRQNGWAMYAGLADFLGKSPQPYQAKDHSQPQGILRVLRDDIALESPALLDFGAVEIGAPQTISLHLYNSGSGDVSWVSALEQQNKAFQVSAQASCANLAPGAQCTVQVIFAPQTTGELTETLRFDPYDDPTDTLFSLNLSGTGIETIVAKPNPDCQEAQCTVGDGSAASCSEALLRQALQQATEVTLHCPGAVITLTQPFIITQAVSLRGAREENTQAFPILDGGGQTQLFIVQPPGTLTLEQLTLRNGYANATCGGAVQVLEEAGLHLRNVTLRDNRAENATQCGGGAVFVDLGGSLQIENALLADNQAGLGGALYFHGAHLRISDSLWLNNHASDATKQGKGGAMLMHGSAGDSETGGQALLERNLFVNNQAQAQGGAVWSLGTFLLRITSSAFIGNQAVTDLESDSGGYGGAVASNGQLTCTHCSLVYNHAGFLGGALYNASATHTITLKNSVLAYNSANNDGLQWAVAQHCEGKLSDEGGNWQFPGPNSDTSSADQACSSQISIADPLIKPPADDSTYQADDGLSALRQALLPTPQAASPLINAAVADGCTEFDLTGKLRASSEDIQPQCDSGAVEWRANAPAPQPGSGLALDLEQLTFAVTDSVFQPVLQANGESLKSGATLDQSQTVTVAMDIVPQNAHQNIPLDTVIVAEYLPPGLSYGLWFTRNGPQWQAWDGNLSTLPVTQSAQTLGALYRLEIFHGPFANLPGQFTLFAGYLTPQNVLIYNGGAWMRFTIR